MTFTNPFAFNPPPLTPPKLQPQHLPHQASSPSPAENDPRVFDIDTDTDAQADIEINSNVCTKGGTHVGPGDQNKEDQGVDANRQEPGDVFGTPLPPAEAQAQGQGQVQAQAHAQDQEHAQIQGNGNGHTQGQDQERPQTAPLTSSHKHGRDNGSTSADQRPNDQSPNHTPTRQQRQNHNQMQNHHQYQSQYQVTQPNTPVKSTSAPQTPMLVYKGSPWGAFKPPGLAYGGPQLGVEAIGGPRIGLGGRKTLTRRATQQGPASVPASASSPAASHNNSNASIRTAPATDTSISAATSSAVAKTTSEGTSKDMSGNNTSGKKRKIVISEKHPGKKAKSNGDEGQDSKVEEEEDFDPQAPVAIFDHEAQLENRWDAIHQGLEPFLQKFATETIENAFDTIFEVCHLFYKMDKETRMNLVEGIEAIKAQEELHGGAKKTFDHIAKETQKFAEMLKKTCGGGWASDLLPAAPEAKQESTGDDNGSWAAQETVPTTGEGEGQSPHGEVRLIGNGSGNENEHKTEHR
ncbi:hypothetical protein IAU59_005607 [Kwoniella sp. CBS 9459]